MKAYDHVWFVGNNFMATSFGEYFQNIYGHYKDNYVRKHYDVLGFCNTTITEKFANGNVLTKIFNGLTAGINSQTLLPKAVVVVVDDDILDAITHYKDGISYLIGKAFEWLANQMHQAVSSHKERLPSKARKFKYPTILWALIPYHDIYGHYNEFKAKYNKAVKHIVSLFREMDTLSLKSWIPSELSYFSDGRINAFGLSSYWQSVSDAFEE